jgi:hypothetical protein
MSQDLKKELKSLIGDSLSSLNVRQDDSKTPKTVVTKSQKSRQLKMYAIQVPLSISTREFLDLFVFVGF